MSQPLYQYDAEASTSLKTLRVFNILSFIASFTASIYAFPRAEEINHKHNIFSPSLVLIAILWPIIYLLRFGFVFYVQFSEIAIVQDIVTESIGLLFTLSNLFMLGWLWFWVSMHLFKEFYCNFEID